MKPSDLVMDIGDVVAAAAAITGGLTWRWAMIELDAIGRSTIDVTRRVEFGVGIAALAALFLLALEAVRWPT